MQNNSYAQNHFRYFDVPFVPFIPRQPYLSLSFNDKRPVMTIPFTLNYKANVSKLPAQSTT